MKPRIYDVSLKDMYSVIIPLIKAHLSLNGKHLTVKRSVI